MDVGSIVRADRPGLPARRHLRAWYGLVAMLALHVLDEAETDFLGFYNPLVTGVRERVWWFPMPTFAFGTWLAGLIALLVILVLIAPLLHRWPPAARAASRVLAVIMFLNGCGHLLGSAYFGRWLPGTTSAPLLLVASVALLIRTRQWGAARPSST
jgi:hypothetical protein